MRLALSVLLLCTLFTNYCRAADSGVAEVGPDTFYVARVAPAGSADADFLKEEAYLEVRKFCHARGARVPSILKESETKPPYVDGSFPKVEIQFRCVTKDSRPPINSFWR